MIRALLCIALALHWCAAPAAGDDKKPTRGQFYGAIAYHADSKSAGWATDRRTAREAKVEALRQCGHERCEVVASITRGCGAVARGRGAKLIVERGATGNEAQTKALRVCGAGCEVVAWTCTR